MFVLNIFRICHAINWSFMGSKNFSSTRSIEKYDVCIIVCIFYILLFSNYGRMFSSDFILAVQKSFSYLRKVTTTADHTAIGYRYSVENTLHLPRLPPPPTLIFLRPPYPWPLTPSTLVRRAWHQGTRDVGANNSLIIAPPPSHACGRDGMPPIVYTPYRTSCSDSLGRR